MPSDGISFIVPNWNHELVLPRALDSALRAGACLRERGLRFETLVVDDASRDGSRVLLRQLEALYAEKGLRVLALRDNAGPSAARSAGLAYAAHRYVVFMDADDEIVPENVFQFYRSIRQTKSALVYGNLLIHEPTNVGLRCHESFQTRLFTDNYIDIFSMCDAYQLKEVDGFWKDDRNVNEDWELYLHLAAAGRRVVHVPLLFGYCHRDLKSFPNEEEARRNEINRRLLQRVYRQFPEARTSGCR